MKRNAELGYLCILSSDADRDWRRAAEGQSGVSSAISGTVAGLDGRGAAGRDCDVDLCADWGTAKGNDGAGWRISVSGAEHGRLSRECGGAGFCREVRTGDVPGHSDSHELDAVGGRGDDGGCGDASSDGPTEPAHVDIVPLEIERMPTESLSSPLSSLVTMTTPGAAADSNGSFHPLGDHAEASIVVDGQPITDQQSRTFSTQISLNALQSLEVREGAPGADVGDKTSMVIVAQTRSGLDQRTPHGSLSLSRGTFASSSASGNLGFGTPRFGSFTAVDALNSGRFLDAPETVASACRRKCGELD